MATVPIVTEVTFAQLEALVAANGLNEGLQYKVTDKDWLLIATSSNTLKAATGSLLIINGTVLPTSIVTDILLVDTGIIANDISRATGIPFSIIVPEGGYFPVNAIIKCLTQVGDALTSVECFGVFGTMQEVYEGGVFCLFNNTNDINISDFIGINVVAAENNGNGTSFRAIIKFNKSYMV